MTNIRKDLRADKLRRKVAVVRTAKTDENVVGALKISHFTKIDVGARKYISDISFEPVAGIYCSLCGRVCILKTDSHLLSRPRARFNQIKPMLALCVERGLIRPAARHRESAALLGGCAQTHYRHQLFPEDVLGKFF
jgi:hypothetical protein